MLNNTRPSTKSLYEELGFETQFDADEDDDLTMRHLPSSVSLCINLKINNPLRLEFETQIDYRNHRCMQPVKNQGRCGSCSAFAATAAVEFAQCIKTGTPVNLRLNQIELIQLETIILFDNYYTASSKLLIAIFRIENAEEDRITNTGSLSSQLVVKLTLLIILTCQVKQKSEDQPAETGEREPNWLLVILSSLFKKETNMEL